MLKINIMMQSTLDIVVFSGCFHYISTAFWSSIEGSACGLWVDWRWRRPSTSFGTKMWGRLRGWSFHSRSIWLWGQADQTGTVRFESFWGMGKPLYSFVQGSFGETWMMYDTINACQWPFYLEDGIPKATTPFGHCISHELVAGFGAFGWRIDWNRMRFFLDFLRFFKQIYWKCFWRSVRASQKARFWLARRFHLTELFFSWIPTGPTPPKRLSPHLVCFFTFPWTLGRHNVLRCEPRGLVS